MEKEFMCQKKTKDLLLLLNKAKTKQEFIEIVIAAQTELKAKLIKYGTLFYPNDNPYSEDIVGQSVFQNPEIIEVAKSFLEINFIRRSLIFGWVTENLPGFELMEIRRNIELRWSKLHD